MPAYPTHSFFSHLALQALIDRRHPLAAAAAEHEALFRVAGIAGCDIQCMPYQLCGHCGAPYRHDQKENRTCLVCHKEALHDFTFKVSDGRELGRRDIESHLYGNTHLVLYRKYRGYGVPPNTPSGPPEQPFPAQVIRHLANCLGDADRVARPRQRDNYLTFILGWFSHVVCDAVFKGVYPGAVQVNFFGEQYSMKMLPAAETLTMTDLSYDFGVAWPVWHRELLKTESDGGALKHLAMGNSPDHYDPRHWTEEFGRPDPAIGHVLEAVPPLNRKWFYHMYTQPDYRAASPRLDPAPVSSRARWRFGEANFDLGQLRQYAFPTGWYEAFIKGVKIYMAAVEEASRLAGVIAPNEEGDRSLVRPPGIPSWGLWQGIITDAIRRRAYEAEGWGSHLEVDPRAGHWLRELRGNRVQIQIGRAATDYQRELGKIVETKFPRRRRFGKAPTIIIGTPAFNPAAKKLLCVEDTLRLKYDHGIAGIVRVSPDHRTLLLAGLSDFGDDRLADWLKQTRSE